MPQQYMEQSSNMWNGQGWEMGKTAVRGRRWARGWTRGALLGASVVSAVVLGAGSAWGAANAHGGGLAAAPRRGGTLTVLENSDVAWSGGLSPFTNTSGGVDYSLNDAIFGELFELQAGGKVVGDLATGYKVSDRGKTLTIYLRHGVTFSDGTPFDAAAVAFNFRKDLTTTCSCKPTWTATSIEAPSRYTVVVHLKVADGAVINQFQDSIVNWMASPTAVGKMSATAFASAPVGAGPFEVVSDTENSRLVLRRNPHYWQPGHPYLNGLIFHTVANDETALEVMRSGGAQAYNYMDTPQLVSGFRQAGLQLTTDPAVFGTDVQMNAEIPPFNNLKAREAIYYATDAAAIDKAVYNGTCPLTESFTGPGGLFYNPKVPGYRNYDLAKAKALVKQIGGLSFTMYYFELGNVNQSEAEALQTMYQQAGMQVTIKGDPDIASLVATYNTHKWTIIPAAIGAWDPATATGVAFRLLSTGPFTGIADKSVDKYINAGVATSNPAARAKAYASLASVLNQKAYTPFICAPESWDVVKPGVQGPGLTSVTAAFGEGPLTLWEDVSMK